MKKFVELTQYQAEIKTEIQKLGDTLVIATIDLEGRERAKWKYDFAITKGEHLLPRSVNDEFKFTTSDTVQGTEEFSRVSADVDRAADAYFKTISIATMTKATLEVTSAIAKQRHALVHGGLTIARSLSSRTRFEIGNRNKLSWTLEQTAAGALDKALTEASPGLMQYLGAEKIGELKPSIVECTSTNDSGSFDYRKALPAATSGNIKALDNVVADLS